MTGAQSSQAPRPERFPRISDYAYLSDCHTGALIAPDGSVEWLCVPRFDSGSVFGAILDRGAGRFRLGPATESVPVARRYEPGTMIVETTWATATGWVVVRDALTIGPWHEEDSDPHRRPPSDHEADHVLVRTVLCLQGSVEIEMACDPAFSYGLDRGEWHLESRHAAEVESGGVRVRLTSDMNLGIEATGALARHRLEDGERAFCGFSWSESLECPASMDDAHERLERTADYWRQWLAAGDFPDHPWRIYLQRSALTLKGLMYAPTGAITAAATRRSRRFSGAACRP